MIQLRTLLVAFALFSGIQSVLAHPAQPREACPFGAAGDTIDMACRKKAEQLLDEALSLMEQSYYRRNEVSWPQLISDAKARLRDRNGLVCQSSIIPDKLIAADAVKDAAIAWLQTR